MVIGTVYSNAIQRTKDYRGGFMVIEVGSVWIQINQHHPYIAIVTSVSSVEIKYRVNRITDHIDRRRDKEDFLDHYEEL